jgi:hypothetical protein
MTIDPFANESPKEQNTSAASKTKRSSQPQEVVIQVNQVEPRGKQPHPVSLQKQSSFVHYWYEVEHRMELDTYPLRTEKVGVDEERWASHQIHTHL